MEIRRLTNKDRAALLHTLNGAFADYIVPFQLDVEQLQFKMASEDVLPEYSAGVFDAGKLIAFIMHGFRTATGKKIMYNAGTGTLPAYRGNGLVGKMYDYLLPFLKAQEISQLVLEVIENNQRAIRAYEKNGFSIRRKLLCFAGTLQVSTAPDIYTVLPLHTLDWGILRSFWDIEPAWQNAIATMDNIQPKAFGAFAGDELIGYILFNPDKKRLYQLAVAPRHRRKGVATQLLKHMQEALPQQKIQWNNVEEAATGLKLFLEKQGLANTLNQFEMIKNL
ncbi:MAG: GNAT family N-acetyltransferase [Sphingobacteriales bacterium]|nr:MAG: GNAT family N-acetyltransferase [Sphingobacteriales bacterium]